MCMVYGLGEQVHGVHRSARSIAAYILSTQMKDFMGLGVPGHLPEGVPVPPEFIEKVG